MQTIKFSEKRGGLAAALVVRPHQELLFISQEGMVQRTGVRGIRQTGRSAQGVTLMNVRDDDRVSAVALVVESDAPTAAAVADGTTPDRRRRRSTAAARWSVGPEIEPSDADAEADDLDDEAADDALDGRELSERGLSRRCSMIISDHQRKEVVRIGSSSSCGTLEVTGR